MIPGLCTFCTGATAEEEVLHDIVAVPGKADMQVLCSAGVAWALTAAAGWGRESGAQSGYS